MNRNYNTKSHIPSMRNIEPLGKDKLVFRDTRTRRTYNRKELCIMINNGEIEEGHVRNVRGKEVPCRNPIRN